MDDFTKTKMFNFILEVKKLYDCARFDDCDYELAQYSTCLNLLREIDLYNEFKAYAERLSIKA